MKQHDSESMDFSPVNKRYSLLEQPDTGERWPEHFDAITIEQKVTRFFKAREARRILDNLFEIPAHRQSDHLYGLILHYPGDENRGLVMFDTNQAYYRVAFDTAPIIGTKEYGYMTSGNAETLKDDLYYDVRVGDLLTYFKTPHVFEPVEGEVLSMMIAVARDELRPLRAE